MRQRQFVISIFMELGSHAAFAIPDLVLLTKSDDSHAVASAEEILVSLHEQCSSVFGTEPTVVVARTVFDRFCDAAPATREAPDRLAIAVA